MRGTLWIYRLLPRLMAGEDVWFWSADHKRAKVSFTQLVCWLARMDVDFSASHRDGVFWVSTFQGTTHFTYGAIDSGSTAEMPPVGSVERSQDTGRRHKGGAPFH